MSSTSQVLGADVIMAGESSAGLVATVVLSRLGYKVVMLGETGHIGTQVDGCSRSARVPRALESVTSDATTLRRELSTSSCGWCCDLDDCIAWSCGQFVTAPWWLAWRLKPACRHPLDLSTVDQLHVGSATAETQDSFLDIECAAGLDAADLADHERGHLIGDRR